MIDRIITLQTLVRVKHCQVLISKMTCNWLSNPRIPPKYALEFIQHGPSADRHRVGETGAQKGKKTQTEEQK